MEPMGIERHRRSPKGEGAGANESIEARARKCTRVIPPARGLQKRSRREWSRWESSDIDEAGRVSERERTNQSKPERENVPELSHPHVAYRNVPGGNRTH